MPTPSKAEFIALIKKFRERKASDEEIEFIKQYYQYFDREEKMSMSFSSEERKLLQDRLFRNINEKIEAEESRNTQRRVFSIRVSKSMRVAAAILLLITSGVVTYLLMTRANPKNIASVS